MQESLPIPRAKLKIDIRIKGYLTIKEVKFRDTNKEEIVKLNEVLKLLKIYPEWGSVLELVGKDMKKLLQPNAKCNHKNM